jgi:CRP/FNR family cyclic AMP-dependent transcriptional regulator
MEALGLLRRTAGFAACPPEVLDRLMACSTLRRLRKGEYAVRRGDAFRHTGMLLRGTLDGSITDQEGRRHLTGPLLPGDWYSMLCVIDRQPHQHDVCAREDSLVASFPAAELLALRDTQPAFLSALATQIALRTRRLFDRVAADPGVAVDVRAARMLVTLGELHGRDRRAELPLHVPLSQSDLADWLGLSRQRTNFVLRQLESEGLVKLVYAGLDILDPAGLRARAGH